MRAVHEFLHSRKVAKYVFLIPGLIFFVFIIIVPFFSGVHVSFTNWNGLSLDPKFIGFTNYVNAFHDKRMLIPMRNTVVFGILGTIGNLIVALGTALLVNHKLGKLTTVTRTTAFTPICFSAILTAFVWSFLYREAFPAIFGGKNLLGNAKVVIPAIIVMSLWNGCGINMLIYLSGLKGIPTDFYEAAEIDGVNAWQKFRHITIPLLMPSFTVCVTLSLTGYLREFAMTLAATGGGPGQASKTMSIYIYEMLFKNQKAGYGQAIAILFCIVCIVVANLVSGFFRKREVEL